jgi:hypothetical protein
MCPPAGAPQCFRDAVDAGRSQAEIRAEMLAIADRVHGCERVDWARGVPTEEGFEVAEAGANRTQRQVLRAQQPAEVFAPGSSFRQVAEWRLCFTQCQPTR